MEKLVKTLGRPRKPIEKKLLLESPLNMIGEALQGHRKAKGHERRGATAMIGHAAHHCGPAPAVLQALRAMHQSCFPPIFHSSPPENASKTARKALNPCENPWFSKRFRGVFKGVLRGSWWDASRAGPQSISPRSSGPPRNWSRLATSPRKGKKTSKGLWIL